MNLPRRLSTFTGPLSRVSSSSEFPSELGGEESGHCRARGSSSVPPFFFVALTPYPIPLTPFQVTLRSIAVPSRSLIIILRFVVVTSRFLLIVQRFIVVISRFLSVGSRLFIKIFKTVHFKVTRRG